MPDKLSEDEFTDLLLEELKLDVHPHKIARKKSLLYDLAIDESGVILVGVDPDSGTPIRGGGKGFEQDVLIYSEVSGGNTSVVPRVVVEIKYAGVTTHDAIVYSEKATRIRRIYPYVRYGLVIGGFKNLPARVLRLGPEFDFVGSLRFPFFDAEIQALRNLLIAELQTSLGYADLLSGKKKVSLVHRASIAVDASTSATAPIKDLEPTK
jgi:hypothetical protein